MQARVTSDWRDWLNDWETEYVRQKDEEIDKAEREVSYAKYMRQLYMRRAMQRRYLAQKRGEA